jgi:hypothetical protein
MVTTRLGQKHSINKSSMKFIPAFLVLLLGLVGLCAQETEKIPLNERRTTVTIWNQHNGGFNDRGSKVLNVVLITKGKEVFRKDGVVIPWERGTDTFVSVVVPSVPTDTVRVEVVDSVNERPGLAEIQFVRKGKNLAKKKAVRVNGVWESHPGVTGDTLTDEITTSSKHQHGYWCSPDKEKAWAEVDVKTRD